MKSALERNKRNFSCSSKGEHRVSSAQAQLPFDLGREENTFEDRESGKRSCFVEMYVSGHRQNTNGWMSRRHLRNRKEYKKQEIVITMNGREMDIRTSKGWSDGGANPWR